MRYPIIAVVIALLALAIVPAIYSGLDVEGESRGASATLSEPPTPVVESGTASRTPRATATAASGGAALGQQLATQNACLGCHSITGATLVGPSWKGLAGSTRQLSGGGSATADDAYLRESIVSPNAKVANGFQPNVMPQDFGTKLTADQVTALVEYIKTLQ
ncbi:MAG: c-type cytochrome [Dehalococcoidia bacterium]